MPPLLAWLIPFVLILGSIVLGFVGALYVTGRKVEIRDWVEWTVRTMSTLPSTNLKLLAAIVATQQVILGTQVLLAFGVEIDEGVLAILAAAAVSVDVAALKQFGKKRETSAEHLEAQARARAVTPGGSNA